MRRWEPSLSNNKSRCQAFNQPQHAMTSLNLVRDQRHKCNIEFGREVGPRPERSRSRARFCRSHPRIDSRLPHDTLFQAIPTVLSQSTSGRATDVKTDVVYSFVAHRPNHTPVSWVTTIVPSCGSSKPDVPGKSCGLLQTTSHLGIPISRTSSTEFPVWAQVSVFVCSFPRSHMFPRRPRMAQSATGRELHFTSCICLDKSEPSCTFTHVHIFIVINMYSRTPTHVHKTHVHIHIFASTQLYVPTYMYNYMSIYICLYLYMYIDTWTVTYSCSYIYIHTSLSPHSHLHMYI